MKRTLGAILATLAVSGCNSPDTVSSEPRQESVRTETELSGGASVVVIRDDLSAVTTFTLEGILLETDGMSLLFRPEVMWDSGGQPSARITFEGTVHGPRWSETILPEQTVLPVITGTDFIRLIGDRASVSFFREHAIEFSDNGPGLNDPYRFQAVFSLEPPILENILAAEEFIVVGENPDWRLQFGDSQKDACRRFLDISLGNDALAALEAER
jgi:hypothetical protein